jgi:hypothetical protein
MPASKYVSIKKPMSILLHAFLATGMACCVLEPDWLAFDVAGCFSSCLVGKSARLFNWVGSRFLG